MRERVCSPLGRHFESSISLRLRSDSGTGGGGSNPRCRPFFSSSHSSLLQNTLYYPTWPSLLHRSTTDSRPRGQCSPIRKIIYIRSRGRPLLHGDHVRGLRSAAVSQCSPSQLAPQNLPEESSANHPQPMCSLLTILRKCTREIVGRRSAVTHRGKHAVHLQASDFSCG